MAISTEQRSVRRQIHQDYDELYAAFHNLPRWNGDPATDGRARGAWFDLRRLLRRVEQYNTTVAEFDLYEGLAITLAAVLDWMGPAWEHTSETDLVAIRDAAPVWSGVQRLDNIELAVLLRGTGADTSPEQQVRFTAVSSAHPGLPTPAVETEAAERFRWASSWLHAVDDYKAWVDRQCQARGIDHRTFTAVPDDLADGRTYAQTFKEASGETGDAMDLVHEYWYRWRWAEANARGFTEPNDVPDDEPFGQALNSAAMFATAMRAAALAFLDAEINVDIRAGLFTPALVIPVR